MVPAMLPRFVFRCIGLTVIVALCATMTSDRGYAAATKSKITIIYRINFAGLNLGKLKFHASRSDDEYAVEGTGRLEFLAGMIWKLEGGTESSGAMTANGPRPTAFSFHFVNGKKRGKLNMRFRGNEVREIKSDLPSNNPDHPRYVPVTRSDMTDVLDPVSALFLTANGKKGRIDSGICDTRMPVFDGKHRFDLKLSHKRTVRVASQGRKGYAGPAVICSVKYIPVSGYKKNQDAVRYLSSTNQIEAWFIPVSNTGIYVPYHIQVPSEYGPIRATSVSVHVKSGGEMRVVVKD